MAEEDVTTIEKVENSEKKIEIEEQQQEKLPEQKQEPIQEQEKPQEQKQDKKAEKKEKNKQKPVSNDNFSSKLVYSVIISCLGFFASAMIAVSLILQLCFKDVGIVKYTRMVGEGIAYIISILLGFSFVKNKKIGWIIAWTAFAVIIVVFFFLR